jgi:MFS family permease
MSDGGHHASSVNPLNAAGRNNDDELPHDFGQVFDSWEEEEERTRGRSGRARGGGCLSGVRGVFGVRSTSILLLGCAFNCIGFLWAQFLGAHVVQHITGSPRLVQLTGSCQFGPMLLGPLVGSFADRVGQARLQLVGTTLLCGLCVVMAGAVASDWPVPLLGDDVMGREGRARSGWLFAIFAHMAVVGLNTPLYFTCHMPRISESLGALSIVLVVCCVHWLFGCGSP